MYYKEYLRARGALVTFIIVAGVLLAVSSLHIYGAEVHPTVTWTSLFAVAGVVAAIMATCLGCTLSQESDGHLELACTKPYSRTRYATTTIAIDMAAIVLSQLVTVVVFLAHYVLVHHGARLVPGSDTTANIARFTLFPLAWYALIAALSAGLRGKAGVVQGLIWPIAITLAVLRDANLGAIWHDLLVVVNWINPLILVTYHERGNLNIGSSAASLNVVASAAMLAALVIAGWVAAVIQWRRVEA